LSAPAWLNQAISSRLSLSTKSIEGYVRNFFAKLDLATTPTTTAACWRC
jgi:DNA-binding NarL/FixJ family response regulator